MLQPCDNCLGQDEYIKSLQSALREVSEENEVLRESVVELEAMLSQLEEDIQEKDAQLVELEGKAKHRSKPVV
jgi:septal ring factor EnvC (AmiA/AmiB activator)